MSSETKTTKKRDQNDTKAKLLEAALDIFSKNGFDAATTRNIAKKAGVNDSLIQRYFESKLGLFLALKQQYKENLYKSFLASPESESFEAEIVLFLQSRLQTTKREKKFMKLAISRALVDPPSREDLQKHTSPKPAALIERFERFRDRGQLRRDLDLDEIISILSVHAFSFSFMVDAMEAMTLEQAGQLIRVTAKILANGLRPQ